MIELISAAKVDKISETDVSLPEKVVSNQENVRNLSRKCQEPVPWQIIPVGTCIIVKITLSNKKKQKKITLFQCIFGLKLTLFQWIPD